MQAIQFRGKVLVIGCGAVSQCVLPLLLKLIDVQATNVTILDFVDNRCRVQSIIERGAHYVQERITRENLNEVLSKYVGQGDLIIDLAWNIDCIEMLNWCRAKNVL